MSDEQYPSLQFDPARGNAHTVGSISQQIKDTGNYAREAHDAIKVVQDQKDTWTGPAAKAFSDKLGDLPDYLYNAHTSLQTAGKALSTWQDKLAQLQARARQLEEQCRKAIEEAEQADTAAEQANAAANTPITTSDSPDAAESARQAQQQKTDAATDATRAAGAAWAKVDDIRRQARELMNTWEDDARICADTLQRAADMAPDKGFWESVGDALAAASDWTMDHLGEIGDVAGMISAVAGALSFIPVLAPVTGPIALAAGGVALAAHGGEMAKEGKWDEPGAWVGLGTDMLGVLPGVGAAAKGMSAATDTMQVVDGLGTAATTGGRVFLQEAGQVAEPAKLFATMGDKVAGTVGGNADTIAKAAQNTWSLSTQVPTGVDMAVGNDTTSAIKDGTGYAAGAAAAGQSVGEWSKAGGALGQLGGSLSDFARAVG